MGSEVIVDVQGRPFPFDFEIAMEALKAGYRNYIVGVLVKHLSGGKENIMADPAAFLAEAREFGNKWKDKKVWTTTTNFVDGVHNIFIVPSLNG